MKAFEEAEFDLIGVKRERGKPAIALGGRDGRHIGNAFITLPAGIRERLWRRVEEHAGPPPKRPYGTVVSGAGAGPAAEPPVPA